MAQQEKRISTDEALAIIWNDSSTEVCVEDSSSEEDDLILPEEESEDEEYQSPQHSPFADPSTLHHGRVKQTAGASYRDTQLPESEDEDCIPPRPSTSPQPSKKAKMEKAKANGCPKRSADTPVGADAWCHRYEEDSAPESFRFIPTRPPGPTFDEKAAWTPLSLFQLFFSSSVIQTIIDNTNANAAKRKEAGRKFHWTPLTIRDFYVFLAIIIYTGLVNVHHRADYWRGEWPYNFQFPRDTMPRNQFESILWSLHLSNVNDDEDNEKKRNTPDYDRLCKIRPLYDDIVTACKEHYHPYKNICIDERMVACKAPISMKQCMKDEPTNWGYKVFVLADSSNGYTWNFFVHTGKGAVRETCGLSYSSVVDLLPLSLLGQGYTLYVDNFYTSPALFSDLYQKQIACCGTIRKNQTGFPRTNKNDFPKKAERGDVRWIRKNELLFVKWIDTREVTMCSTAHKAFSGKTVRRKVKEAAGWTTKAVPVPDSVLDYNKNMGGVHLSDVLIRYYTVHHKTMKWYKTFFYHFLDIAIVNCFILHKELCKTQVQEPLTQKKFREKLAKEMLDVADASVRTPPPRSSPTCMPYYYGSDASESRQYCRLCRDAGNKRVKTPIYCQRCNVPLCLTAKRNCFVLWHTKVE